MRDTHAPYPTSQEIFERVQTLRDEEMWSNLYKKDLIKVGSIVGHHRLRLMEGSPYLEALLKRGLKR